MNVIKPKTLGILTRPFMFKGRRHFAVTSLAFFDMAAPDALLPDTALWPFVAEALGDDPLLDSGMPKAQGEVVVEGAAIAADGAPVRAMGVRLRMGTVDKRLRVYGDRHWLHTSEGTRFAISEPAPFTEMELTLARAFGGPGFPRNPGGKGHDADRLLRGGRPAPLYNVGHWDDPVLEPGQDSEPATLGAIPYELPQRMAKAGTYDQAWLRDRFPGWADDVDWTIFNVSAPDQWIDGFWRGDEPFLVVGMSAGRAQREGRLPGIAVRIFVERADGDGRRFGELKARLDTVWLFPNQGKGIVAHRATARDIVHPDGGDIGAVMLAWERMGETPRPAEHYAEVLRLRADPATRAFYALADSQLVAEPRPEVAAARREEKAAQLAALRSEQEEKVAYFTQSALARAGIALPAGALPAPPPGPKLPHVTAEELERGDADLAGLMAAVDALVEETRAEAERQKEVALEAARKAEADARSELEAILGEDGGGPGADPAPDAELEAAKARARARALGPMPADGMDELFDLDRMLAGLDDEAALPAAPAASGGLLDGLDAEARAGIMDAASGAPPGLDLEALLAAIPGAGGAGAPPERAALAAQIDDARLRMRDGMHEARRASPEALAPLEPLAPEVAAWLGALVIEELARGTSFAGRDLAGAALPGADLSRRDLQGTLLERAALSGADLSGSDCRKAVFTGATLVGARLSGARLAGANLSGADLTDADLSRADLTDALLTKAQLGGASLAGARLSGVQALQASFGAADLSFCRGRRLLAIEADLTGARAVGCRLTECVFLGADLRRADFLGADLTGSVLMNVKADGLRLSGARLARLMASGEGSFRGMTGIAMRAAGSGWRGACLAGADLTGARLDGSDLATADLSKAVLAGASLVKAMLSDADLTGAWLTGADLMEALLRGTRLAGATLVGASLYAAELTGADLADARLAGADLRLTDLERRRA